MYHTELKLLMRNKSTLFYGKSVVHAKEQHCTRAERFHNYQQHVTTPNVVRAGEAADLQCACTKKRNLSICQIRMNLEQVLQSCSYAQSYQKIPNQGESSILIRGSCEQPAVQLRF